MHIALMLWLHFFVALENSSAYLCDMAESLATTSLLHILETRLMSIYGAEVSSHLIDWRENIFFRKIRAMRWGSMQWKPNGALFPTIMTVSISIIKFRAICQKIYCQFIKFIINSSTMETNPHIKRMLQLPFNTHRHTVECAVEAFNCCLWHPTLIISYKNCLYTLNHNVDIELSAIWCVVYLFTPCSPLLSCHAK